MMDHTRLQESVVTTFTKASLTMASIVVRPLAVWRRIGCRLSRFAVGAQRGNECGQVVRLAEDLDRVNAEEILHGLRVRRRDHDLAPRKSRIGANPAQILEV